MLKGRVVALQFMATGLQGSVAMPACAAQLRAHLGAPPQLNTARIRHACWKMPTGLSAPSPKRAAPDCSSGPYRDRPTATRRLPTNTELTNSKLGLLLHPRSKAKESDVEPSSRGCPKRLTISGLHGHGSRQSDITRLIRFPRLAAAYAIRTSGEFQWPLNPHNFLST